MLRPLLLPLTLIPLTACGVSIDWDGPSVAGSGAVTTDTRTVSAFERVDVGGEYDVVIRVGTTRSVVIEGDDNLLPLIRTEVREGTLHIDSEKDLRPRDTRIRPWHDALRLYRFGRSMKARRPQLRLAEPS